MVEQLLCWTDLTQLASRKSGGTSGPELAHLLSEFQKGINRPSKSQTVLPHHEDTSSFQQQFRSDGRRVFTIFSCNHFEQVVLTLPILNAFTKHWKLFSWKLNLSSMNFGILNSYQSTTKSRKMFWASQEDMRKIRKNQNSG